MTIQAKDLKLDKTCVSCPEQYNVYYHGQQIGYIRRRWDRIWVHCPNVFVRLYMKMSIILPRTN